MYTRDIAHCRYSLRVIHTMQPRTINVNDRPRVVSSTIVSDQQIEYRSRTLHSNSTRRYTYLPIFPREALDVADSLLLAHVPGWH